jgi:hypothetical protein
MENSVFFNGDWNKRILANKCLFRRKIGALNVVRIVRKCGSLYRIRGSVQQIYTYIPVFKN